MYLLDTNVVSELRKATSGRANKNVVQWASNEDTETLFISVITVLELEMGILSMERRDQQQGLMLRRWLEDQVLPSFEGRILPIDIAIARALQDPELNVLHRYT
jgi:predicted nucleic acid-binding protein